MSASRSDSRSPLRGELGPKHPVWYLNLSADPDVVLQDGPDVMEMRARTASSEEKAEWWPRATAVWPPYDDYQARTERDLPVVILEPRSSTST